MAIIGAHDMTYLGRATNVKLQTKINGTHTLTFQMPDKWFDSEIGDFVQNEFKDYVSNENKVKLYYKDQWLEFFVKNVKMNKHYKSYMYEYSCSDAFIDELSRNGYGLIFDTELYNNVEEIGTFTEDILEDSYWGYAPENNWGDFTEYTEERLFKIPVSCFKGNIKGYKLNFTTTSEDKIINKFTGESKQLELGDDLAREKEWFWDCYDNRTEIPLLKDQIDVPNDGYIYVPYSQLNFCYVTTSGSEALTATEEPATGEINNLESLLITPPSIDPSKLIQFIAIPEGAEVEVDEAGLIVNKNYTYVMAVEDWNKLVVDEYWYSDCATKDDTGYKFKKEIKTKKPDQTLLQLYNKAVVYDGYLDSIGRLEVETGKKIAISDRTEINISEEIDQYVTVYNNKSEDYAGLYTTDENWNDEEEVSGYRVCSKTATRQIIPQLARNYFENGVNIQNTSGWEVMQTKEVVPGTEDASCQIKLEWIESETEGEQKEIKETKLNYIHSAGGKNTYPQNIIINFGAVGQNKKIEKGKVYCFGLITDRAVPIIPGWEHKSFFMIGKGSINSEGNYEIEGTKLENDEKDYIIPENGVIYKELQSLDDQFYIFKSPADIENPYLCLYFNMEADSPEENRKIGIKEVWFFEAYTKGQDQFGENESYFKYSGRDYILQEGDENTVFNKIDVSKRILFETDIMRGDTYGYQQYFIQCAYFKDDKSEEHWYDTFMQKKYISEDVTDIGKTLPLPASKYTEDDIKIITRYIDLNQCEFYTGNTNKNGCDCKYPNTDAAAPAEKFCMYQKYGYCPYRFQTEKHCRKIRTLNGSKSNRFNLTQELSKVFEIYPIYYIEHSKNGAIVKDNEGHPIKNIFYITEKGSENKLGFRYEKNLSNITKTVVSDQIVTKLYVEDNDSELSKTGLCSIKTAEDNPSKDNFIIDLSYYIKQGMLDKDRVTRDLYGIKNETEGFLKQLGYYNTQYDQLSNSIINLQNESFGELESNINVSITGIESVLKEIAKLNKQMSRYKGNTEHNETYSNYEEKKKQQQSRLASLVKDLVDEDLPLSYINNHPVEEIREDFEEKHITNKGMLGQYNKEYEQIQTWKKQRAVYLKAINDLSAKFFKDYEAYLKEGTWTNSNYLTDNAYYHDAIQVAAEGAIPKVTYDITVVSLGILDEDYNVDIADTTYVEDIGMFGINAKTGLPNKLKVLISELNESLDKPSEDSIKVQNFTTQFEDLFQQVTASVQSLTFNENIYKRSSNFTANQNIETESLQGTLDGNDLTYLNTDESNIVIDQNGQSGSNINNHNSKYKISGEGLFFSKNGGVSWDVGVGPEGINADYINTGTLDAGNIRIVDNDYIYFLWDKGGITAYRTPKVDKQNPDSEFGKYFARFNKYGLSLVENNQIRLRAGYEFWDNDSESGKGKIYNEDTEFYKKDGSETIARNIGFYLYNNSGEIIFKTEASPTEGQNNNTARISLAGEMYINESLKEIPVVAYEYSDLQIKTLQKKLLTFYKYEDTTEVYNKISQNWTNGGEWDIAGQDGNIIHYKLTKEEDKQEFIYSNHYYKNQVCRILTINSKSPIYLCKPSADYAYTDSLVSSKSYYEVQSSHSPSTAPSKDLSQKQKIEYYDSDGDKHVTDEKLYCYQEDNYFFYYKARTEKSEPTPTTDAKIGLYLNNQMLSAEETSDGYYRRIITCASNGDSGIKNVFSILSDGGLYIGGSIEESENENTTHDIAALADRIKIIPDENTISLIEGHIRVGSLDLYQYFGQQISDLSNTIANLGLISHAHGVSSLDVQANIEDKSMSGHEGVFSSNNDKTTFTLKGVKSVELEDAQILILKKDDNDPNKYNVISVPLPKLIRDLSLATVEGTTESAGDSTWYGGGDSGGYNTAVGYLYLDPLRGDI